MIKAIQTRYRGYRFRSRLEARWAVFFDKMNLDWSYEPQGFDLGRLGWYLPDFVISGDGSNPSCIPTEETMGRSRSHFFIEIKGKEPSITDCEKLAEVCEAHTCYGAILFGDIPESWQHFKSSPIHKEGYLGFNDEDFWFWFEGCRGKDDVELRKRYVSDIFDSHEFQSRVNDALTMSRSARFEHGETPR